MVFYKREGEVTHVLGEGGEHVGSVFFDAPMDMYGYTYIDREQESRTTYRGFRTNGAAIDALVERYTAKFTKETW